MDVTQIIIAVVCAIIAALGSIITKVVIPYIKANTNETTQAIIESIAEAAVYAAQQICISSAGTEKKEYAVTYMTNMLAVYDITLDEDAISDTIEAALKAVKTDIGESWTAETSE